MYLVLFGMGLLVTAAGLLTIGFGIPINAFSLGNTLIISGTVAVTGGLVLIGLAAAVRQLNRIAVALNSRAAAHPAAAPAPTAEHFDSLVPPTARIPQAPVRTAAAPKPPEPPRPVEPHFPAVSSPTLAPLDWLRSKPKNEAPPPAAEPPVMDVSDEVPLSPRAPQRPMFSPPPFTSSPASEPPGEPKAIDPRIWAPTRGNGEPKPDISPVPRSEQIARMLPPERQRDIGKDSGRPAGKDAGLFDVVWPDARSKPMPGAEPPPREMKPEPAPMPPSRPREESRAEKRAEPPSSEHPAILKSGVIDGMAYTLYADGSIEAELPQGTVRFASVDALRAHLEKSV
jgi:hypothetical protein